MLAPAPASKKASRATIADPTILIPAIGASFKKLDPRALAKNPVMFVVEVVALLTTVLFVRDLVTGAANAGFSLQIILWLWFTVLFANFAEAVAEGRGKAQAASLRATKTDILAKKLPDASQRGRWSGDAGGAAQGGRHRARRGGRSYPVGRRSDRRRRFGERGRHHRRVRAGDPRVRAATARPSPAARS